MRGNSSIIHRLVQTAGNDLNRIQGGYLDFRNVRKNPRPPRRPVRPVSLLDGDPESRSHTQRAGAWRSRGRLSTMS